LVGKHRSGVFAEKVRVPRRCIVPLPEGIAADRAVLAEPLACCVDALRPETLGSGTRVFVLGCGAIGLLTILLVAQRGAEVVAIDPMSERRSFARGLGVAPAASGEGDLEQGSFDLVIDAAGFESTWRTGIDALRNRGTVASDHGARSLRLLEGRFRGSDRRPCQVRVRHGVDHRSTAH
jgi:threonine dehydrogenase-like Zn-dependent dehydrogenase